MATRLATSNILPVVLAGGSGKRLWPLSREHRPKQFLRLLGETTLLQRTLIRLGRLQCRAPYVVCNREHRRLALEQCAECGLEASAFVIEPAARNTAPAAALAAFKATQGGADPVLLVLPADHHIADESAFAAAVGRGVGFAEADRMVVFGVRPSHPASEYGYIRAGAAAAGGGASVAAFVEKPAPAVARRYLEEGGWYWNSGMFLVRAGVYLAELARHRPDILEACRAAVDVEQRNARCYQAGEALHRCPAEPIDRAVMEKTDLGIVVAADMGWSDIGNWAALAELMPWDGRRDHTWGRVETSRSVDGIRLRRLTVLPGKTLAAPVREGRPRYWVVVRGRAEVVRPGERRRLAANKPSRVPSDWDSRLANVGQDTLVVIEVPTDGRQAEAGIAT